MSIETDKSSLNVVARLQRQVDAVPSATEIRRRGRPFVPDADRHRTVALSLPPDGIAILKDDALMNNMSASAYVLRLLRDARAAIVSRDPISFFADLVLRLNEAGVRAEYDMPQTVSLVDLIVHLPFVSVTAGPDHASMWLEKRDTGVQTDCEEELRLLFHWHKVWDGKRYEREYRTTLDLTHWTTDAVVAMVKAGGTASLAGLVVNSDGSGLAD